MDTGTRFWNQRGLIDGEKLARTRFIVVGAGAIGSFFVVALSKMGARRITVYDFDKLEDHNFANQMHPISQLGKAKVDSLKVVASDYGDCEIEAVEGPWTEDSELPRLDDKTGAVLSGVGAVPDDDTVVVSCVDNMDVRRTLWEHYRDKGVFFIDGRMSALVFKVYGVDTASPAAKDYYERTLHSQAEAAPERCGEKSIIYTVLAVSSQMLFQVHKWLNGAYRPTEVICDLFNNTLRQTYHMEQVLEVCEEEPEETTTETKS